MYHPNTSDVDPLSRVSVFLKLFFDDQRLACGSGLLARTPEGIFLISALHNFTGREPSGKCKSDTGALPNFVEVTGYGVHFKRPLHQNNDPSGGRPLFWLHPKNEIDVSVLPLLGESIHPTSFADPSFLDPNNYWKYVELRVTQTCFVIGYPEGLYVCESPDSVIPIWVTGHIGSEPRFFYDAAAKTLINAATLPGMSGSPVFVRNLGRSRLLGIYTGRTSKTSQLGFVFSPQMILEIIAKERSSLYGPKTS
jgi:hypothetical protein